MFWVFKRDSERPKKRRAKSQAQEKPPKEDAKKPAPPIKPVLDFKGFHVETEDQARKAVQKVMLARPEGWTDHDYEFFIGACRAFIKTNSRGYSKSHERSSGGLD